VRSWTFCLVIAAATAAAATTASAQSRGDVKKGLAYAEKVCAECHAVRAGETNSPKADATPFDTAMRVPGMTPLALNVFFQSPHPTMPNLIVTGQNRDNLIAYMLSLKGATY